MNRRPSLTLATGLVMALALTACGSRQSTDAIAAANGPDGSTLLSVDGGAAGTNGGVSEPGSEQEVPGAGGAQDGSVPLAGGAEAGAGGAAPAAGAAGSGAAGPATGGQPVRAQAGGGAAANGSCTRQLSPIIIGQVGGFTGLVSNTLAGAKIGLPVWVAATNAKGGVACHPIRLVQADDASDASKSSSAVRDLVENKKAIALVGSAVPISIAGFRSAVESVKVPAVGGDSLNPDWNESPMLFPQGTTFAGTVIGGTKQNADRGKKKLGLVYCVEAANCTDAYQVLKNGGAAKAGANVVYESQVSLTSTDYSAQCQAAKSAGADQLLLAMDGSAIQRFERSCAALNYFPAVATSAIAIGSVVSNDKNARKSTVSVGHIVFPWMRTDTPAQIAYAEAMKKYAPDADSDGSTSQTWVAGEMFRFAIESLGAEAQKDITTAMVFKGLGNIKNQTFGGLTTPVTITIGQARAPENNCYFPVLLQDNGWGATSSKPTCFS